MTLSRFDRLGGVVLTFVFGFSTGVAVSGWEWFPTDVWNDIATIPPTGLNYTALLLPWVSLLLFLLVRRRWHRDTS